MRKILLAAAAAASLAWARLFGSPIDDTAWQVKIKPDSLLGFSHKGVLRFEKGRLQVDGSIAEGFAPASYSAQSASGPDGTVFTAALSRGERGVFSWQGMVRGDEIKGVAVLWRPDGKAKRFVFKGTRKSA